MVQTSPNTGNYMIGKGVLKIKVEGIDPDYRFLGNSPLFETTPNITRIPHYSSQKGSKFKDKQVTQVKELTMKMTLDEITPENLQLALLGSDADSTGLVHNILDLDEFIAAIRFVGTNSVGDKQQLDFPTVSIFPSAAIPFISDGWLQLEITGDVLADENGNFGTIISGITEEVNP